MKNKIAYTFLLLTAIFLGCKKDLEVIKEKEYPIAHQYDAFYKNGALDSLIHVFGDNAEYSHIQSVQRNDSFYRVILWDGNNPKEMLDYTLDGDKVVAAWYYNHDSSLSYLKHKYIYQNNRLDSCYTYIHRDTGSVILQHKSHYHTDPVEQYLKITNSELYNAPNSIYHEEYRYFGNPIERYTPFDLFPFSNEQLTRFEIVNIVPRYIGSGRPTLLNVRQNYEYTKDQLCIWHYTTSYYGAANSVTDTTQTIIRYHGI